MRAFVRRMFGWLFRRQPSARPSVTVEMVRNIEPIVPEPPIPSMPVLRKYNGMGMSPYLPSVPTVRKRMRRLREIG